MAPLAISPFEDSRRRCRIHALCVVAVALMALVCSRAAGAAEIFVTSQTSGTPAGCSLVEAIYSANFDAYRRRCVQYMSFGSQPSTSTCTVV
jgi:hypothetical protein